MKICFLSAIHPPLDKRVFAKEAVTLARAGHEVVHLAPDASQGTKQVEGVTVITYAPPRGLRGRMLQLFRLYRRAASLKADVYHCNEVDSWGVGVALKLFRRARIVFDVHEHYPSDFAERRVPRVLQGTVAAGIRLVFRLLSPFTDRFVFAKKDIAGDFPSRDRGILVENFAQLEYAGIEPDFAARARRVHLTAIHIGEMGRVRGWPQLLDALTQLRDVPLRTLLVGKFSDGSRPDFDRRVHELGLTDSIECVDWLPFPEVYRRVLDSDMGLVLFQPGLMNHVLALPHKMFDYMLAGIPVVAPGFAVEVSAIMRDADCGLLIDPSRPADIAAALRSLAASRELRERLGRNGRRAVLNKYNWENEAAKLLTMYEQMEHPALTPAATGAHR